ncbi:hypothetical protein ACX94U_004390 [Enterobacter hormaechei]
MSRFILGDCVQVMSRFTERMAAQTLRRINTLLLEAYREALVLDETFQD